MARIIPVGYAEAAFVLSGTASTPFVTTLGVSVLGISGADLVDAANAMKDAYAEHILPFTASALTLDRVDLRVGLPGGASGTVTSDTIPVPGSRSSASALIALAPVVQKQTGQLGRKGRGRSFLPMVLSTESVDNGGTVNIGTRSALQAAYNLMLTDLATFPVGDALAPVVLHSDETTPTPITTVAVAAKVGIIRGRID